MALYPNTLEAREVTLFDLLDTALDRGIVVQGDATISVADVDLVFLGLKVVLTSVETMRSWRRGGDQGRESKDNSNCRTLAITQPHGAQPPPAVNGRDACPEDGEGAGSERNRRESRRYKAVADTGHLPTHPRPPLRAPSAFAGDEVPLQPTKGSPEGAKCRAVRRPRAPCERLAAEPEKAEKGLAKLVLTVVELLRRLLEQQAIRRMQGGSLSEEEIERMGEVFQRLEHKIKELKRVFGLEGEELNLELGPLGRLM